MNGRTDHSYREAELLKSSLPYTSIKQTGNNDKK